MKQNVSITLDKDVADRVKDLAAYDGRSFSQYVNLILRKHMNRIDRSDNKKPEKNALIL